MYFSISNTQPISGPGIFGYRLRDALEEKGHVYANLDGDHLRVSIIEDEFVNTSSRTVRIHRVDGIYFDSAMTDEQIHNANYNILTTAARSDGIVFQSNHSFKLCTRLYPANFNHKPERIIYNGAPDSFFNQDLDRSEYFIASASWRRHKRLEETVAAFADPRLAKKRLIVLGGVDYSMAINPYFKTIPPNVHMFSKVPHDQLESMYGRAAGMIHLCWLDSCPNTVVEALASGTPVLCSHNGGTHELVQDNGVVIQLEEDYQYGTRVPLYNPPVVDINTIVEGVLELEQQPRNFTRKDLSMSHIADSYCEFYKKMKNLNNN